LGKLEKEKPILQLEEKKEKIFTFEGIQKKKREESLFF